MSPRSLLFSSDQETSRQLRQVLHGLEFEVESCCEIFAAIERITAQSFDLIVADWDDGLEARFLLKTSRELKMNAGAVTVAVTGNREATSAAHHAGAAIILNKPVVVEQAKITLLSADDFLRGMRTWVPRQTSPAALSQAASQLGPQLISPPHSTMAALSSASDPEENATPSPPSLYLVKGTQTPHSPGKRQHWTRLVSLACALGIALSSAGYLFSAPMHGQEIATSVQQIYEKAVTKTHSWLEKSADDSNDDNVQLAQNNPRPANHAVSRIQVTPVHEYAEPSPAATLTKTEPPPSPNPQPDDRSVALAHIPESLRAPAESIRSVAERVTPTLLGGLEPVNLSENLAAQLLLQRVDPSYPQKALQAGLRGPVVFQAWIARDGSIRDLKLIRGSLLLGQAAYSAVKQWKYKPYLLNGQAVETQTYVTVNFGTP